MMSDLVTTLRHWVEALRVPTIAETPIGDIALLNGGCISEDIKAAADEIERQRTALSAAFGYLLNAKIDLQTGAPKSTAIQTIEGGLRLVRDALREERWLCTDCNETHPLRLLRDEHRCPVCGGARTIPVRDAEPMTQGGASNARPGEAEQRARLPRRGPDERCC